MVGEKEVLPLNEGKKEGNNEIANHKDQIHYSYGSGGRQCLKR
jgi:hypothetical protein